MPHYDYDLITIGAGRRTVSGGAGGGTLPPLTRTAELPVRVAEVQAINDHVGGSR